MRTFPRLLVAEPQRRTSADGRIARLRQTIAAERELLGHPVFAIGAARVIVDSRSEIRRIERHPRS
ncbi:MAG: hypothetical protein M3P14_09405 [Chloroflexota bacterium]|nr:hypothetical protein [Chloroflexota bacterium]